MEEWEIKVIKNNFEKLIKNTRCTESLLAYLIEHHVLGDEDVEGLIAENEIAKSRRLYNILFTRHGAYKILLRALREGVQSGAAKILNDGMYIEEAPKGKSGIPSDLPGEHDLLKSRVISMTRNTSVLSYLKKMEHVINTSQTLTGLSNELERKHTLFCNETENEFKQQLDEFSCVNARETQKLQRKLNKQYKTVTKDLLILTLNIDISLSNYEDKLKDVPEQCSSLEKLELEHYRFRDKTCQPLPKIDSLLVFEGKYHDEFVQQVSTCYESYKIMFLENISHNCKK